MNKHDRERHLFNLYRTMQLIRKTEEAIADHYLEQEMRCPVHLSIGQEAVSAGACLAVEAQDLLTGSHRCHGPYLAKGGDLNAMIAEIYGKATGCMAGRGGSMHLFDDNAGILANIAIVGSSIALGVGAALACKQQKNARVTLCFLGDAALEEGVFHESANFAATFKLPVVFICENNEFSVYTHLKDRQPNRSLTAIGKAHGMMSEECDGNDAEAVFSLSKNAVDFARNGNGPSFLVFHTYRFREHCGPNYDLELNYRDPDEVKRWEEQCPILRIRRKLTSQGHPGQIQNQLNLIDQEISEQIELAFRAAKSAPFPDKTSANTYTYQEKRSE